MSIEDFIISVFCLIDDEFNKLHLPKLRSRGKSPELLDSEVITMEIIGESLGYDKDKTIWQYFRNHWKENMEEARPKRFLNWMKGTRRLVETVIGQLAERFHIETIRARDLWHQSSRFWRKLLAHTVCMKINIELGNEPLQFERLLMAG
jgi:hypothetical protein